MPTDKEPILRCPLSLCDGSGWLISINDGHEVARLCQCIKQQKLEEKFKSASIPEEFSDLTVDSFSIELYKLPENQDKALIAKTMAENYVQEFPIIREKGKGLYFYSGVKGSGKTRMAASIGNALLKMHHVTVKFITTIDFFNEIKSTYDKETGISASDLIDAARNVDVLILDDIGTEKQESPWVNETLYAVFDHRMTNRKVTLFTSNCTIDELQHNDKIKSRIKRMALPIWMPEEEIRGDLARKENEDLQALLLQ